LGYGALKLDRYGSLVMGAVGALIIVFGKFRLGWDNAAYGGVALLVAASIWNSWPRRALSPSRRLQEARLREALMTVGGERKTA
jgi:hypothetical protein